MRWFGVALMWFASGCSVFLGGDDSEPVKIDASTATPDAGDPGCVNAAVTSLSLVADAEIAESSPNLDGGLNSALAIRGEVNNRTGVLLRFRGARDVPLDASLRSLQLSWPAMERFSGCGGSACSPCSSTVGGQISVRFATNTWIEDEVSWNGPDNGSSWDVDVFEEDGISSVPLESVAYEPGQTLLVPIPAVTVTTELPTWIDSDELTLFLMADSDLTNALFATRENDEGCDEGADYPPAALDALVCND